MRGDAFSDPVTTTQDTQEGNPMQDLELILTGDDAEGAVADLAAALDEPSLSLLPRPLEEPASAGHKTLDPVAVAALVLSIPATVLTVMDIADRIAKRRRARALIETAGRIRGTRRVEVMVVTISGPAPLADLEPDALLDLIAED